MGAEDGEIGLRNPLSGPPARRLDGLNVQFGAGWSCPENWLNYDSSPSVRLERLPVVGRFLRVNEKRFPEAILYGDIVAGLPVAPMSAKAVYASHVLEHLSFEDCRKALRNTFAMLKPGGIFRLVVPSLEGRIELYLAGKQSGDADAANAFNRNTLYGLERQPRGLAGRLRHAFGNSHHLWMWDEAAMREQLTEAGFINIRRARLGDSSDPDFAAVEDQSRFFDQRLQLTELALEAQRPV